MELKKYLQLNKENRDQIEISKFNEEVCLHDYAFSKQKFKEGDYIQSRYSNLRSIKIEDIYPTYNMYGEPTLMYTGTQLTVNNIPYKDGSRTYIMEEDAILKQL